ncbi:MAG: xanthine dehydrogenase molybdopterin binding subunit [Planctomycetes bacterium]|nr:xanthine dehydrogenase molybdopterin binding subunit [Planctomycetota bacterium]
MPTFGKPIPHDSATGHVTGSALFIDDCPPMSGELFVDFVGAPCASGVIKRIDVSKALSAPGVAAVLTHEDIPGRNLWGPIFHDEPILVADRISYLHQPVAIIAAESREAARAARSLVTIEVDEDKPILTIDEAIERESFLASPLKIERGDVESALASAPHTLSGVFRNKGQEQFYLESQAAIAYPGEDGQVRVVSSTQNPTETQIVLAEVLGVPMSRVVCECKRMGGGFGGKETQSVPAACFAALVAMRTGRSARVVYTKDDDMHITGKRHAYRTGYRVGFDEDGRVLAVDFDFVSDGGAFCDLSTSVLERTLLHSDNAYYLPTARLRGWIARTNTPPNTAFRGFGGPQAIIAIEAIMSDIAHALGRDPADIRRINLYGEAPRNVTPYGQIVRDHVIVETADRIRQTSNYDTRRRAAMDFNARSKTHLKGVAMTPVKFGISFTTRFLNQGNALVNVYEDGSVQVSTGGTEMGQGLNVKIRQIVADEFGIAVERVQMMTTSTEKNANTSPTAASASTDLNGTAAANACEEIKARMAQFAATLLAAPQRGLTAEPAAIRFADDHVHDERDPSQRIAFTKFCHAARRARVDLGARGFYATPGVDFNRQTGQGSPFLYYTTGAAVAEVTIDRFTGATVVDRIDVLMDIGRSINPGVDRGQIIGGFVQGMGWCTTEDLCYDARGELLSHSPTTYKIPDITDIPAVFNVDTIGNPRHVVNIRRSKAVGEPPLMLGICVWAAVKEALNAQSKNGPVALPAPATGEVVLMTLAGIRNGLCHAAGAGSVGV